MALLENLRTVDLSEYDSNDNNIYLDDAIEHGKENVMTIANITNQINFNNEFLTFDDGVLTEFKEYLRNYTVKLTNIDSKYFFRPDWVAKVLYGSSDLWYLVLIFNDEIPSALEFNKKEIIVYNPYYMDILNKLIKRFYEKKARKKEEIRFVPDLKLKEVRIKDRKL